MMRTLRKMTSSLWKAGGCIVFACLLVGCKSSTAITSSNAAIMKSNEAFFTAVLDRSFHFDTFSARLHLDFNGMQQEFSSRVQLKMIRDDRLQLSIQPFLGVEVVRVELSNDSIKIIDRMNKRFLAENYQRLKSEMAVDFNFQNLQALLTNQLFVPGENRIASNHFRRFRITNNSNQAEFQFRDIHESSFTFTADGDEKLLSTKIEFEQQMLSWQYSQFQAIDDQIFPMKMTARLSSADQTQGTVTLAFSTPERNHPISMDFTVPAGYNRVTLEQMLHSIGK